MPTDKFEDHTIGLESPPTSVFEITPDDANDLAVTTRALNVATSGTVTVTCLDGTSASVFVAAGVVFPIRVTRVWAAGTSASEIRGLN